MIGSMDSVTSPPVGNLLYSEVEQDLRVHLRTMLSRRASWTDVLARTESSQPVDRDLWYTLAADMGCAGLSVPDEIGGGGATWREASVVAEELGRAVAPVPFLGCSVAAALLLELGEKDLLAAMVRGEHVVALALPYDGAPHESTRPTIEERDGLRGSVIAVGDASAADVLLVPTGDAIHEVGVTLPGVTVAPSVSLDMTRPLSDVVLDGPPGREVARGAHVHAAIGKAQQIGATLLAAEQLGVAERCLEMTVEHLGQRRQFGRLIGSYQALKHRVADLWGRIMKARAVARYAAECAANASDDLPVAAAMAQEYCSRVAQQAAEECLQMHGGIGFTWEYPVHLYLKRAKSSAIALGSPDRHRTALATLLDLER
ncbi:acyl-CoA dehydrogenase family protein [Rhodococcus koreensis]